MPLVDGRPLAFLAFQASALSGGFPTEMAVLRGDAAHAVRIRPDATWSALAWDADVEAVSGLSRTEVDATGVTPSEACRRLSVWTEGHCVVVRHEAVDLPLLRCLHDAAGLEIPADVRELDGILDGIAGELPFDYWARYGEMRIPYSGLRPHRAGYDAALRAEAADLVSAGRPRTARAM